MRKKRFHFRSFTSLLLLLGGALLAFSGIVLYLSPHGRVANWTGWRFLGLTKDHWEALHTMFALVLLAAVLLHLFFNWKILWSYLRDRLRGGVRMKRELAAAALLTVALGVVTLLEVPPASPILALGERLTRSWSDPTSEPPVPQAEELTLAAYTVVVGLEWEAMQARLAEFGYADADPTRPLGEVAADLGISPRVLAGQVGGDTTPGGQREQQRGQGGAGVTGFGRLTVETFSHQEGIALPVARERLQAEGITPRGGESLRGMADRTGRDPADLARIIRGP